MFSSKTKAALVWLACVYVIYHFTSTLKAEWHFIDNVDLIIHEAGHMVFMPFGQFIMVLGGSLLQVLVPIMFFVYFYRAKQHFSQAVMLLWIAVNLFYIGLYASDAIKMELPLLGGDGVAHDWNYLLMESKLIAQTKLVSDIIYFAGLVNIFFAAYIAFAHYKDPDPPAKIFTNQI